VSTIFSTGFAVENYECDPKSSYEKLIEISLGSRDESIYRIILDCIEMEHCHGNVAATFYLGLSLIFEHGLIEDLERGKAYIITSAEKEFHPAMLHMALAYEYGDGLLDIEKHSEKALIWYEGAAYAGNRIAAARLARAYQKGEIGVEVDARKAKYWMELDKKMK
jgi:hypothetical protein